MKKLSVLLLCLVFSHLELLYQWVSFLSPPQTHKSSVKYNKISQFTSVCSRFAIYKCDSARLLSYWFFSGGHGDFFHHSGDGIINAKWAKL